MESELQRSMVARSTRLVLQSDDANVLEPRVSALTHILLKHARSPLFGHGTAHTDTVHGQALLPHAAASCANDSLRIARFLQAVHRSVITQRERLQRTIGVLDAGSGPLAITTLPLLLLHEDVMLTAVDLHEAAVNDVLRIADVLGIRSRVRAEVADVTRYQVPADIDIAVSETMSSALLQEPQAHITAHLAPQLRPDAIWLPQGVEVNALLRNDRRDVTAIARLYELTRQANPTHISAGCSANIVVPARSEPCLLQLQTLVHIDQSATLTPGTTDITQTISIADLEAGPPLPICIRYPFGGSSADIEIDFAE